jgi:hypothetical protein
VKHHGIDSADSPLCASAIRVRQQNGLNGRASSVPTSSNSFKVIEVVPRSNFSRHCEERKRRSNPFFALLPHGLLRFARNDGSPIIRHAPPPGLAFGEPDDRLHRGIQYAMKAV